MRFSPSGEADVQSVRRSSSRWANPRCLDSCGYNGGTPGLREHRPSVQHQVPKPVVGAASHGRSGSKRPSPSVLPESARVGADSTDDSLDWHSSTVLARGRSHRRRQDATARCSPRWPRPRRRQHRPQPESTGHPGRTAPPVQADRSRGCPRAARHTACGGRPSRSGRQRREIGGGAARARDDGLHPAAVCEVDGGASGVVADDFVGLDISSEFVRQRADPCLKRDVRRGLCGDALGQRRLVGHLLEPDHDHAAVVGPDQIRGQRQRRALPLGVDVLRGRDKRDVDQREDGREDDRDRPGRASPRLRPRQRPATSTRPPDR